MADPERAEYVLPPHARRHLGRLLAALYDALPLPPADARLTALLRRLEAPGRERR